MKGYIEVTEYVKLFNPINRYLRMTDKLSFFVYIEVVLFQKLRQGFSISELVHYVIIRGRSRIL